MEPLSVYNVPQPFNESQKELIKSQIAKGCTDGELQLFIAQCERTGLDPFSRQIYALRRRSKEGDRWVEKMSIQVSIDGFRAIAERTGEMDGQETVWFDSEGKEYHIWLSDKAPAAAMVLVYRKGCAKPFPGVAKWSEYVQTGQDKKPTSMWTKMPATMLAKCAESLALRKAFPNNLSGLYTREEMMQAEEVEYVDAKIIETGVVKYNGTERDYDGGYNKSVDELRAEQEKLRDIALIERSEREEVEEAAQAKPVESPDYEPAGNRLGEMLRKKSFGKGWTTEMLNWFLNDEYSYCNGHTSQLKKDDWHEIFNKALDSDSAKNAAMKATEKIETGVV